MSSFCDRLREERKRLGLNQEEFGALGGVKKGAQINYEKGDRAPDADYLANVAVAGADVLYLITGQHSPAALTSDENELLNGYRSLDVRGKAGVLGMIQGMTSLAGGNQAVFHGDVGQTVQGNQTVSSPMTFNVGAKKTKK